MFQVRIRPDLESQIRQIVEKAQPKTTLTNMVNYLLGIGLEVKKSKGLP